MEEVRKVVHGKWVLHDEEGFLWECSECKLVHCCRGKFCSNCGAKMDLEGDVK